MQKIIHFLIIIVLFFVAFFPKTSGATSGACSWHNGVNCNLGRQANGTVYCNDGWTDSMVLYEYTAKCQTVNYNNCNGYSSSCKYLNDLNLLENKKKQAREKIEKMLKGVGTITNKSSFWKSVEIDLTIKKGRLSGNYLDYMCNCVIIDETIALYGETPDEKIVTSPGQTNTLKNKLDCPESSYESDGKCLCPSGFTMKNNECVSIYKIATDSLINTYKKIQESEKARKNCSNGYQWDSTKKICVPNESKKNIDCPLNSSLLISNNLCYCDFGYAPFKSKCVKVPEHAHAANSGSDAWQCDDGYQEIGNTCAPMIFQNENTPLLNDVVNPPQEVPPSEPKLNWLHRLLKFFLN